MKKIIEFFNKSTLCNLRYYFLFFIVLASVNFFYFFQSPLESYSLRLFFFFIHLAQSLSTTLALLLVGSLLKRCRYSFWYVLFIGTLFLLLFVAVFEAFLIILMDVSIKDGLEIAFGADLDNFIELLYLSDIGILVWLVALMLAVGIPFMGIGFYKFLNNIYSVTHKKIAYGLIFSFLTLCILDVFFFFHADPFLFEKNKKTLLWKDNFFKAASDKISLKKPIQVKISYENGAEKPSKIASLPNVYLFIAESLRSDYITKEITPALDAFKKSFISAKQSFSSANCTHYSWFSIFYSNYPFSWSYRLNEKYKSGSPQLRYLKNLGYSIHLYTSAQIKFYHFDETLFGKNLDLLDSHHYFPHYETKEAYISDQEAIDTFIKESQDHENEGHVYIFFLDSTHFNYSWPSESFEEFKPYGDLTWKMRLSRSQDQLEGLKNRYKNSLRFLDQLFAKTLDHIKKKGDFEKSLIVFCGDHGEEFKEEGKLFHASHLSTVQIKTPIFYKLGMHRKEIPITSHVDIFPSIVDAITQKPLPFRVDGESVLSTHRKPFALSARYNASHHPYKFMIHDETSHVMFKFKSRNELKANKKIKTFSFLSQEEKGCFESYLYQAFPDNL